MRLFGNLLQFSCIVTSLFFIGKLLPLCIFQCYTWLAHIFLCIHLANFILLLIQDYFFTAMIDTKNKAVLVTGCDTGFGNSLAKIFDRKGYKVFACCFDETSAGASELKEICSSNTFVIQMDVTDDGSVARALETVEENLNKSKLWAIVNNAGVLKGFQTEFSTMSDYEMCMQVNALGMVRVTKAFLPMLRESRGRVVNIASLAGRASAPFMGAYMSSKRAAVAFSEVLCQEMRAFGVRVISVEPEFFKTGMCAEKNLLGMINRSISAVNDEVMSAYGKDYIENVKNAYVHLFSSASPDVKRVYDAVESAICLENPADVYRPMRNFFIQILFIIEERVPQILKEIFLQIILFLKGVPTPKKGMHILFRLINVY